jgi:hypothetical protein
MSTLSYYGSASYSPPSPLTTKCYLVTCTDNGASYTLTVATDKKATCTSEGDIVTFSGYGGSVECGNPASICGYGDLWDGFSNNPVDSPHLLITGITQAPNFYKYVGKMQKFIYIEI